MEPISPRPFDPDQQFPDPDAEAILTVTFLLELPHCLRIGDATFLVSDRGQGWSGWSPDAIGYMAELAPVPEGVEPRYRISLRQGEVDDRIPLLAAERAFPNWEDFERPQHQRASGTDSKLQSCALISIYGRALESPLADELDEGAFRDKILEWLSRRFDEALSLLNQYVVILAALHDEWHISSISRIDLPRHTPWKLDLHPTPDDWSSPSGTLDVHATLRDDLPDERPENEIVAAVNIIHEARAGRVPFFQWLELYQSSEHHLGSGRNDQSVMAACTATEVLINTLFRLLWTAKKLDPKKLPGVLSAPFKNQVTHHLPKFLSEKLVLDDDSVPPGRWHQDCYLLRNRIVHEGHKATSGEAYDSKVATGDFARWIGAALEDDPRTADIKSFLQARPPSRNA